MAQEIPENHVAVKIIIGKDGTYKAEVVGHGKNAACLDGYDDKLLKGLTDEIGEATGHGHTDEHYREKQNRFTSTVPVEKPKQIVDPIKQKDKKLDMGYGV